MPHREARRDLPGKIHLHGGGFGTGRILSPYPKIL